MGGVDSGADAPSLVDAGADATATDASLDAGVDGGGCEPGTSEACTYSGPPATEGVGPCRSARRTCGDDGVFGACEGEVLPTPELCGNGVDDDCSGISDDDADEDGDGWTRCGGDCCDGLADCDDPLAVNPGAFEVSGNGIDDDCSAATDDSAAPIDCAPASLLTGVTAMDLARAMDLCRTTSEADDTWGLISASLTLADGTAAPDAVQVGVLDGYGPNVTPTHGASVAALSSGTARYAGQAGWVPPEAGPDPGDVGSYVAGTTAPLPAALIGPHGGVPPSAPACGCTGAGCSIAHDSVRLRLRLRVPTNARSLSYRVKYYTAEYPMSLCAREGADLFVSLLVSSSEGLPADTNIAIASDRPLNLDSPLVTVCAPGGPSACPDGTGELVGTGMGGWMTALDEGAATPWLYQDAPVVPGEIITLDLIVLDGRDGIADSLVLLDGFRWSTEPATVGLHR